MSRSFARFLTRSVCSLEVLLAAGLLGACASGSSPKGPVLPAPGALRPATAAPAPAPVAPSAPSGPVEAVSALEAPAVAARFPAPAVDYALASLRDGRAEFTTADELQALMLELSAPRNPPDADAALVNVIPLGKSQSGAPLQALLFTRHPTPTPSVIVRGGKPTVLLIGQQHGDEPASAEALLVVAQALANGNLQALLDRINVIVLPRVNPDGAARGQAASANGIDIDTDHLLVRTPEARAVARLVRDFQPVVVVDAHEYPLVPGIEARIGGVQRADAQLQYAGTARVPEFMSKAAEEWFRQPLLASLKQAGLTHEWSHRVAGDAAAARLSMGGTSADSARNTNGLRNAVSFVIESRGGNLGRVHLKRRVHTHVTMISSILRSSAQRAEDLSKLRRYVDTSVRAEVCKDQMVIDAGLTAGEQPLTLLDAATGADRTVSVKWDSSLTLRDGKARSRPCGYWLGADQTDAVSRLRALGIRVEQLSEAAEIKGDANSGAPVEGEREYLAIDGVKGSYYVPLSQPWANLAVAALEPGAADGFVAAKVITKRDRIAKVTVVPKVRRSLVP